MLLNILFNNIGGEPPGKSLTNLGGDLIKKSRLTKGMYFLLILDVIFLSFILSYSFISTLNDHLPLKSTDLRIGLGILFAGNILYMAFYGYAEIRDRMRTKKSKRDV